MTTAFKNIYPLIALGVLFWGACAEPMAAQTGRSLALSAAWQRNSALPVGQPCVPPRRQTIEPDASSAPSAKLFARPSLRLLYVLMLLRREQFIVTNPAQLRDKLRGGPRPSSHQIGNRPDCSLSWLQAPATK